MKRKILSQFTNITRKCDSLGESIEEKVRKAIANKEPIEATAPMIYNSKDEGVNPAHDIRTDKWDIALDAIDKFQKSVIAKSGNFPEEPDNNVTPSQEPSNVIAE